MSESKFKVGDRVKYRPQASNLPYYAPEKRGRVTEHLLTPNGRIYVHWENGDTFSYGPEQIELANNGLETMFRESFEETE